MGRPSTYTAELGAAICDLIASGKSLNSICSDESMPGRTTVYQWIDAHPEFANSYARAREDQADTLADEIIAISDETTGDPQRDRLRVDARKWVASKLKPKRYGDKVSHEVEGEIKHFVVEVPAPISREEWLKLSSGVHSLAPSSSS